MISILRVRFDTNVDPSTVWSDQQMENWMRPLIPFSLGDFWWTSSRGLYSLDHVLYPPLVVRDPRPGVAKDNATQRAALKDAVIKVATDTVNPDWERVAGRRLGRQDGCVIDNNGATVQIVAEAPDSVNARQALRAYFTEIVERYQGRPTNDAELERAS